MMFMSDTMTPVLWRLCQISVQAGVLALVILLVHRWAGKRLSYQWRYGLWALVVVRLLLFWGPSSPFSAMNLPMVLAPEKEARYEMPHSVDEGHAVMDVEAVERAVAEAMAAPEESHGLSLALLVTVVWGAGALALLAGMLLQSLRLSRHTAATKVITDPAVLELLEECKKTVGINTWLAPMETPRVQGPALFGFVRPRLLLPEGLTESTPHDALRMIFLHELMHLKRGDILWGWLFNVLLALHWFNPVLWWVRRRMVADREFACDAQLAALLSDAERRAYGHVLLDQFQRFAPGGWGAGLAGILEGKTSLERRIEMITTLNSGRHWRWGWSVALCCVLSLAFLTDAQEADVPASSVDLRIEAQNIFAYKAENGGTMAVAGVENRSQEAIVVEVAFYQRDKKGQESFISKGGLEVPPGKIGYEAVMWPVKKGEYSLIAVADPEQQHQESNENNNRARRVVSVDKKGNFSLKAIAPVDPRFYPTYMVAFKAKEGVKADSTKALLNLFNNHPPKGRTHHYRPVKKKGGEYIGFICAVNKDSVESVFQDHPTLECLKILHLNDVQQFSYYCDLVPEARLQLLEMSQEALDAL